MTMSARIKSTLAGLLVSLLTLALCYGVMEGYLAWRHGQQQAQLLEIHTQFRRLCFEPAAAPELIYTLSSELRRCQANSQGYRDRERTLEKPAGARRVVLIGDSVVVGQGLPPEASFGPLLEERLNHHFAGSGGPVEVILLGQSGYSTIQELYLLEHEAPRYAPDLVLWFYVLNDPAHPVFHDANGELGRTFYQPRSHTAHFVARKLFEIREARALAACPGEYHALLHCVYADQVQQMIGRIGALQRASGTPVLFVIHPVFQRHKAFSEYSLLPVHQQLRDNAEAAGLQVLDLLSAYMPYSPPQVAQILKDGKLDPWHPNELGNDIVAGALLQAILAGGYLALPQD